MLDNQKEKMWVKRIPGGLSSLSSCEILDTLFTFLPVAHQICRTKSLKLSVPGAGEVLRG